MNETFTLTKALLIRLLDGLLYPNPDDPGSPNNPWGPYGPAGRVSGQYQGGAVKAFPCLQPGPK